MSKPSRSYTDKTLKILSIKSGGICAYPNCNIELIISENGMDTIIGEIAHIIPFSKHGPRSGQHTEHPNLNDYNNLIFLCSNHHKLVDSNPDEYTTDVLLSWKKQHEKLVSDTRNAIINKMPDINFAELEIAAKAVSRMAMPPTSDFSITPLRDKMKKNGLSIEIETLIAMGSASSGNVQSFINSMALIDSEYPERLKAGFVMIYKDLISAGWYGDELFESLMFSNKIQKFSEGVQAAYLAILVYLFEKCEVFEK